MSISREREIWQRGRSLSVDAEQGDIPVLRCQAAACAEPLSACHRNFVLISSQTSEPKRAKVGFCPRSRLDSG